MKNLTIILAIMILCSIAISQDKSEDQINFTPINHATFVIQTQEKTIVVDPVGEADRFSTFPSPDIILVTDTPHSYRTHYIFNKIFKENGLGHIRLEVAAAPNDIFNEENWYQTEKGVVFYIEESIKVPFYWLNLADKNLVVPR